MVSPIFRPTARVFVVDEQGKILLFGLDDGTWMTPGGGIDDGETAVQAAARELAEETGHRVRPSELGPVVATAAGHWRAPQDGTLFYSVDSFFFLRVAAFTPDVSGSLAYERNTLANFRWFDPPRLRAAGTAILPWGLADLLPRLCAGDNPSSPVTLPWHHPQFDHLPDPD